MTDLAVVLPAFITQPYAHLIPSLEKHHVTTTDLLTLDGLEIAKRAQLPILDVKALCQAVLQDLQSSLAVGGASDKPSKLRKTGPQAIEAWKTISVLDDQVDGALGGGIPTGYVTEVTGESGAGKTQFLLGLLLATQLPPPHGLSRPALYISTESALPTTRLSQMLKEHPLLKAASPKCSLDRVISIVTPDLESQDHILHYQLPVAIRRHNIGLVVLDSVAANYRAEFERSGANRNGANMAKRSSELVKLGQFLRDIARTEDLAIVVANQVADRFGTPFFTRSGPYDPPGTQSSPLAYRSGPPVFPSSQPASPSILPSPTTPFRPRLDATEAMTLDHQQRWFTGWGDDAERTEQKTPCLGLIWTTQIACRIALIKEPVYVDEDGVGTGDEDQDTKGVQIEDVLPSTRRGEKVLSHWRRWMKVVFAPWVPPSGSGVDGAVEFKITSRGIMGLVEGEGEGEGKVDDRL